MGTSLRLETAFPQRSSRVGAAGRKASWKIRATPIRNTQVHTTRLLYDRKAAAQQLSISVRSLDYLIAGKAIETRRIGKKVLIPHSSLVRFAGANHYGSVAGGAA
jgi:hypothetical protein